MFVLKKENIMFLLFQMSFQVTSKKKNCKKDVNELGYSFILLILAKRVAWINIFLLGTLKKAHTSNKNKSLADLREDQGKWWLPEVTTWSRGRWSHGRSHWDVNAVGRHMNFFLMVEMFLFPPTRVTFFASVLQTKN